MRLPGFSKEVIPSIALEVAQDVEVDASLKVGAASTSVNVDAGTTPILNTSDGTITSTITQNLVNNLPVNGHNFAELTQMVPGSTVADGNQWNGAGQSSPNNSGERVQSFATLPNVNGNRTYTTNFTIDGISIVDTGANLSNGYGTPAYNIAPEAVQEVTIITERASRRVRRRCDADSSHYQERHGQVSRRASATTCRTIFWMRTYTRTSAFCPGAAFTPRTDYTQNQYNGTVGGPVPFLHKKLFFFADYEAYRKPSAGCRRDQCAAECMARQHHRRQRLARYQRLAAGRLRLLRLRRSATLRFAKRLCAI